MIEILVTVLVLVLIAGIAFWLIGFMGLPEPWARAAQVLIALICLLLIIGWFFGGITIPLRR